MTGDESIKSLILLYVLYKLLPGYVGGKAHEEGAEIGRGSDFVCQEISQVDILAQQIVCQSK